MANEREATTPGNAARSSTAWVWLLITLSVATALAPRLGPLLFGFGLEWLFWALCPLIYVIATTKAYFVSGKNRWTLLLWLLAPICFWYPGQIIIMFLIFMFGSFV